MVVYIQSDVNIALHFGNLKKAFTVGRSRERVNVFLFFEGYAVRYFSQAADIDGGILSADLKRVVSESTCLLYHLTILFSRLKIGSAYSVII